MCADWETVRVLIIGKLLALLETEVFPYSPVGARRREYVRRADSGDYSGW